MPETATEATLAALGRAEARILALSAVAADLGRCSSQHDLFHVMGRRLHDLGLESLIMMATPDRQRLRSTYVIAEDLWPDSLASMEHIFHQPWFEIECERAIPCALTACLEDGRQRLVESMLDDMGVLWPAMMAGQRESVARLFPTWRAIYAPLRQAGEIVGLLIVLSDDLREDDTNTLAAFANLLGAMLESVRRLEIGQQRNLQLELLSQLTQAINASIPQLPLLLQMVETGLTSTPRYARARVGLVQAGELLFRASGATEESRLPLDALNYVARAARIGQSLRLNNLKPQRAAYCAPAAPQTRSMLIVPLVGGAEQDQTAGVLCVESDSPYAFDEHDQATIEAIAAALVTALHNVRLYEYMDLQLSRRLHEQEYLLRIGRAVTESLDTHSVFQNLLNLAAEALGAERGWLGLIDEPADVIHLNYIVGKHIEPIRGFRAPLSGGLIDWMRHNQSPLCIPDVSVEGWYSPIFARWLPVAVPHSALLMLVRRYGQPIGALGLFNKRHGVFDDDDVKFVEAISLWASLALENAQLYQDSQDKRERFERGMARLSHVLAGGHDLRATLDNVLDLVVDMVGADAGGVDLIGANKDFLDGYASRHLAVSGEVLRVPLAGSIDALALESTRPVVWDDALARPDLVLRELSEAIRLRSVACVPLLGTTKPLGTLVVFRQEVRPFSVEEVSLLVTFSQQAAIAVERAQLAERTREQDARLKAVLQNMQEGALVVRFGGIIEYVNPAARRVCGAVCSQGGRVQDLARRLTSDAERAYAIQMWQRFLESGLVPIELDVQDDAGERRRLRVRPSIIAPGERYLILFVDITQEYRLERLRHEFLHDIYHEIGTPLTAISNSLEFCLNNGFAPKEQHEESLELAYQQTRRVITLLADLRSYTLLGEPMVCDPSLRADLRQIVAVALIEARRAYPSMDFRERLPRKALNIACDENSIYRAVRHLLDNAAKFSAEAGQADVSLAASGKFARLAIQDHGIGIAPDRLQEIFTPFHQLDDRIERRYRGIGLGLSLVRRVVENAGGTVEVQSTPGQGSTFTLLLPLAQ